jgi:hypothetical protein
MSNARPTAGRALWRRRRLLAAAAAVIATLAFTGELYAYFSTAAGSGSSGAAAAATVQQGATPTVARVGATAVAVTWGSSTLSNGTPVDGYVVTRYDAATGAPQIAMPGCSGTIAGLSCTESAVPVGSWTYAVTPVIGDDWHGAESTKSGAVVVTGVTSLTVAPTVLGGPFPQTVTGSLAGFGWNESVAYRLDAGTTLAGSPSAADGNGDAAVSIGIPHVADGAHTLHADGSTSHASAGIVVDTTAPTVSAQLSPVANAAGWNNASPVGVTLAADDGSGGSGVHAITYTTDGTDPRTSATAHVYSGAFDVGAQGDTTVAYHATDLAGNSSAVATQPVEIDTVAPTNDLTLDATSGDAALRGGTVWYRGAAAGSFTIANGVADARSGPASSSTSALGGDAAGWSHLASLVTTPAGGPYVSGAFSWDAGTSSSPTETVTGHDAADNFDATPLTFADDSAGPSGGSVAASGLGGAGGRYSTSTTLSLQLDRGTDAGVGLAASGAELLRASAPLSSDGAVDGSCGAYGSFTQVGADDPASPVADTVSDHHCYVYRYVVADELGNETTYTSAPIKVDTDGPSTPTDAAITPVTGTSFQFVSGQTLYYNPAQAGSFEVASSAADADSGIKQLDFAAPAGFDGGGSVATPSSGTSYRSTYSWPGNGGSGPSGAQSVTATNNAGATATNSGAFTLAEDAAAPTTSDDSASVGHDWKRTAQTVTLTPADGAGGSGVAATHYTTDGSTPTTASPTGTAVTVSGDGAHTVEYFSVDNVSNEEPVRTAPTTIRIDGTDPVPGSFTLPAFVREGRVLKNVATDATSGGVASGVASVSYYACHGTCDPSSGTLIGTSTTGPDYAVAWTSQPADGEYSVAATVTDEAGNTALSDVATTAIDNTVPATSDDSATIGSAWKSTSRTVTLTANDPLAGGVHSGVDQTYFTTDGTTPSTGSSTGTSVSLVADGSYTVRYFSTDNAGNHEPVQTASTTVRIDKTSPTAGSVATAGAYVGGAITYIENGQELTDPTADDPVVNGASSGIAAVAYYRCSSGCSGTTPASAPGSWTLLGTGTGDSHSFTWSSQPADGVYSLVAKVTDVAGNAAYSAGRAVTIDNAPPTTSDNSASIGSAWFNTNRTVTLTPDDNGGSGTKATYFTTDGSAPSTNSSSGTTVTLSSDGVYTVKYFSVDKLDNAEAVRSASTAIHVDKTDPTGAITAPANGDARRQTVTISASADDPTVNGASSGVASVAFQRTPIVGGNWTAIAQDTTAPYAVSLNTAVLADGQYDLRTVTTDNAGNSFTSAVVTIRVDNTAPTGVVSSPSAGANVRGSALAIASSSADAGSGVASALFQRSPVGAGNWTDVATDTTSPYSVSLDTTAIADAQYDLRVVTTDQAGNAFTSPAVTVRVDNTAPTGAITAPAANANVRGATVAVSSNSSDAGSGVASVQFQRSPVGSGNWTAVATDTSSPYAVTLDTTALADGQYDLQAIMTDNAGNSSTSPSVTVRIDNTSPTNSLSLANRNGGGSFLAGTALYYQGSVAGSFALQNALTDGGSGPAASTFGAFGGSSTGWTHTTPDAQTTPFGGPYVSNVFSWTAGTSSTPTQSVVGADTAGNTAATSLAFNPDTTVPTGGALTVNGTAATAGGSTSTTTNTGFAIGARTDFGEAQTSTQSGLAASTLTVQSKTLTANACGAAGSGGPFTSPATVSGTTQPGGIAAGFCYVYTLTGSDNVTNSASLATTVKLNTSPTVTSTSPGSLNQGVSSQNVTINGTGFVSGASASFSGAGITVNSTSFVSSTQLTANITIAASAPAVAGNITVTNPDGGSGSCANCFTVTIPPPVLSSLSCTGSGNKNTISGTTDRPSGTVTVNIYAGTGTTGSPVIPALTTSSFSSNAPFGWTVSTGSKQLTSGSTYTAQAQQNDGGRLSNQPTCTFTAN